MSNEPSLLNTHQKQNKAHKANVWGRYLFCSDQLQVCIMLWVLDVAHWNYCIYKPLKDNNIHGPFIWDLS